jgi:hypothetical protein
MNKEGIWLVSQMILDSKLGWIVLKSEVHRYDFHFLIAKNLNSNLTNACLSNRITSIYYNRDISNKMAKYL